MLTGKFIKAVLTAASVVALAAPAQVSLVARYLDATTGIDAYYDTDLNITWLRDANARGNAQGINRDRQSSLDWAANYVLGDAVNWRLPTGPICPSFDSATNNVNCPNSEWGHLWYTELGNTTWDLNNQSTTGFKNKGDFVNWQDRGVYWTSSTFLSQGLTAYAVFQTFDGKANGSLDNQYYAMAVHDGDVGRSTEEVVPPGNSVPEPESVLLSLTALGALALARRRRQD